MQGPLFRIVAIIATITVARAFAPNYQFGVYTRRQTPLRSSDVDDTVRIDELRAEGEAIIARRAAVDEEQRIYDLKREGEETIARKAEISEEQRLYDLKRGGEETIARRQGAIPPSTFSPCERMNPPSVPLLSSPAYPPPVCLSVGVGYLPVVSVHVAL